jgi:hypothetical protein
VANSPTNSITAYLSTETGDARPVLTLAGPRTRLDGPVGLTFDAEGRLYVVNHGSSSSVTVYAPFAHGDVAPLRILAGVRTGLRDVAMPADFPTGAIAVDLAHNRMFVARISPEQAPLGNVVLVFRANAAGDESPLGSIGPMDSPSLTGQAAETSPGIAFEGDRELVISQNYNACCHGGDGWAYYRASDLAAIGKGFWYYEDFGIYGFAIAPYTGEIVDIYFSRIDVWAPNTTGTDTCAGNGPPCVATMPLRKLGGAFTAVAVDANDTIWALSGPSELEAFSAHDATPRLITGLIGATAIAIRQISGPRCNLSPFCPRF